MKMKILVVDDDLGWLKSMQRRLAAQGYEVLACHDPQEVGGILTRERPALVLTDVVMPGLNGCELSRRIIEAGLLTQIVLMTGHVLPINVVDAFVAGASDYWPKTGKFEELLEVITRAFARYERWNGLFVDATHEYHRYRKSTTVTPDRSHS